MNTKMQRMIDKAIQVPQGAFMKRTLLSAAMVTALGLTGLAAGAEDADDANDLPLAEVVPSDSITFKMVPSTGAASCLSSNARAHVTVSNVEVGQNLHVEVENLPANIPIALFIIQVPNTPFGLSWYQGDMETDAQGRAEGDFVGIFSVETFTLAPGVAPAPVVFPDNAAANPATDPVQMYHVGIWFGDPNDNAGLGCPGVTPFDGDHEAGIQALNTSNFADARGPLRDLEP
jgi:hypothetical protein